MINSKIRTIGLVLMLNLPISLFISCDNCEFAPVPNYFDVQGAQSFIYARSKFSHLEILNENSKIERQGLSGIQIKYQVTYIASKLSSLSNSRLIACSPPIPGGAGAKSEKIKSLNVISLFDYDDKIKAGSRINEYLVEPYSNLMLDDYILQELNIPAEEFNLNFNRYPDLNSSKAQFKIEIELNNSEKYTMTTAEIRFI